MIISFAGAGQTRSRAAPGRRGPCGPRLQRAGNQRSAWVCRGSVDRLIGGCGRISGKLMLEIAERNGALVKILGRLHLLQQTVFSTKS